MQYTLQIDGQFCSLQDREFEFPSGMTIVSGKNGSGKSSLLRALTLSITDKSLGDRGNQGSRPETCYTLKLANGVFETESGRTEKEGLIFTGSYPNGELKGERQENINKFLGWLEIKPGSAFDTLLERIQFSEASPSIFTLTQKKLLESVTSSLSERTRQYQVKFNNIKTERDKIAAELKIAKLRAQDLSGSEFVSTAELEEKIALESAKINNRPEPFKIPYLQKQIEEQRIELKQSNQKFDSLCLQAQKRIAMLKEKLEGKELDEKGIKNSRDKVFRELSVLDSEIQKLRASLIKPLYCPECNTALVLAGQTLKVVAMESLAELQQQIKEKGEARAQLGAKESDLNHKLDLLEEKKEFDRLIAGLEKARIEHQDKSQELTEKISKLEATLKDAIEAEPFWKRVDELQRELAIIKSNNKRLQELENNAKLIQKLETEFFEHDFHRTAGVRDLLLGHFTRQCSTFSKEVNGMLGECGLGEIEFMPEFDREGNVEKIRLRHFDKGEWRPYDEREGSMKRILDLFAWLANIRLNPKKVDCLKLLILDDFGHVFDLRLQRLLNFLCKQDLVILFAWANREAEKLCHPAQTIILGE